MTRWQDTAPELPRSNGRSSTPHSIVGSAPGLLAAIDLARRFAPTDIPVLIIGETGTGKELLAQYIHRASGCTGHLVDVDCGALPSELVESLLFGHRRGAFTGAVESPRGLIAEAHEGTLFLDELGSMPELIQTKLLRALETGVIRRVGDTATRPVSFRVVATAQTSLADMVQSGRLRVDLVQRVAGVVIQLPALRDRPADVPALVEHFARGREVQVTEGAARLLVRRDWPGNVRQLKWAVTRAALFATDGVVDERAVTEALAHGASTLGSTSATTPESEHELRALCHHHAGDADLIAKDLGIGRSTLYRKLREAGLRLRTFKVAAGAG